MTCTEGGVAPVLNAMTGQTTNTVAQRASPDARHIDYAARLGARVNRFTVCRAQRLPCAGADIL